MTALVVLIAFMLGVLAGYLYDRILKRVQHLEIELKKKVAKKPKVEPTKSVLIDPLDPVTQARLEYEETHRQLNPELYKDDV